MGWRMSNVEMFSSWFLLGVFFSIFFVMCTHPKFWDINKDEQKQQKYATAPTHELAAAAEAAKPNLAGQSQFHVRQKCMECISEPLMVILVPRVSMNDALFI